MIINTSLKYQIVVHRLEDEQGNKNLDSTGDDVFVNLEAFDMLSDFQELDILEHTTHQTTNGM